MRYRCDECSCYLDPDEGRLCDECQEKMRKRLRAVERQRDAVREADSGQYKMILQEAM